MLAAIKPELPWFPAKRRQWWSVAERHRDRRRAGATADRLSLSRRTVDNYLGVVYRKLGIPGREHLPDVLGAHRE